SKIFSDFPGVLRIACDLVRANVGRGFAKLQELVGIAHEEVGEVEAGADGGARTIEEIFANYIEIIDRVVLVRRKVNAKLPVMIALGPGKVVGIRVGVTDLS